MRVRDLTVVAGQDHVLLTLIDHPLAFSPGSAFYSSSDNVAES